jgi:AraC-like DNA-binding protein/quercetin dioxygenase-like cupin family protein
MAWFSFTSTTVFPGRCFRKPLVCQLVSGNGQGAAAIVATFPMPAGTRFEWHHHHEHQLAWSPEGVLVVRTRAGSYVLPPTRALWIPAGTSHETQAAGAAVLRSVYVRTNDCAIAWDRPTAVAVSPLLRELIPHLEDDRLAPGERRRAEAVLFDLLAPLAVTAIDICLPADERARRVAEALLADPGDGRTLHAWGRQVGASSRTLARLFLSETGLSFGRWRTLARLQAALLHLAEGQPIGLVATRVGYSTASAFVAAFRTHIGVTPGRYFDPAQARITRP